MVALVSTICLLLSTCDLPALLQQQCGIGKLPAVDAVIPSSWSLGRVGRPSGPLVNATVVVVFCSSDN